MRHHLHQKTSDLCQGMVITHGPSSRCYWCSSQASLGSPRRMMTRDIREQGFLSVDAPLGKQSRGLPLIARVPAWQGVAARFYMVALTQREKAVVPCQALYKAGMRR